MDEAAIAVVGDLLDAAAATDGRRPLSDHLYLDLVNGGSDGFAAVLAYDEGRRLPHAYAQLSRGNDSYLLELVVHPDHRDDAAATAGDLIRAALGVVAGDGGGQVTWWVAEPTETHRAIAREAAMVPGRRLDQMRRALPTGEPVTIETRDFVPGADDEAWLSVNNRAFADHGEQGGWTPGTLRTRQAEDWFDPSGFRIHDRDGRMAGFCWTKVHPPAGDDGEPLGEIYVIAVDPSVVGRGLGRAMTVAGLQHLAAGGLTVGMLYVESDNDPAVRLYRSLGFEVHQTDTAFEG